MLEAALMAAAAGLASTPHCAGMCGPLSAAACSGRSPGGALVSYQAGRLVAYGMVGGVAGSLGSWAAATVPARWGAALLSWSLALGLLMAAARLLRTASPETLVAVGRSRAEAEGRRRPRIAPALLGALTAALPCGALYAALLLAAGTGTFAGGALSMLVFGAVSATSLVGVGIVARRLAGLATPPARRLLALGLALGALVLVVRPLPSLLGSGDACHSEATSVAASPRLGEDPS